MGESSAIRQAVIPAAGLGSRFLPVTKCVPKELIPLLDKPCLQHVIDEGLAAGVEEFVIVISPGKKLVEDYFRPDPALYDWLAKRGQDELAERIRHVETQASFRFVVQPEPLGLGHAVWCARAAIRDEHFFVILPDDIIVAAVSACGQMLKAFEAHSRPLVAVMPVTWDEVHRYGIVRASPLTDAIGDVHDIVEKPRREEAPSNLAVIGRYVLPRGIFAMLEGLPPGAGGEIQLTDALKRIIPDGGLRSFAFEGDRFDTGTPEGWIEANLALALRHPRFAATVRKRLPLAPAGR